MQEFYERFHQQVKKRINKFNKMYFFGEDSIRYDFYHTAINYFNLHPIDLILEQAIPKSQFLQKERNFEILKQGRHNDKPEFDLRIDPNEKLDKGLIVEFAYFRKTEISSNQDKTGRHGKLMNEMFRLALIKHFSNPLNEEIYCDFTKYRCLLVCITDDEMINYGQNTRGRKPTPILENYILSEEFISSFPDTIKNGINNMFFNQAKNFKIIPTAKRVYNKIDENNKTKWATWIWEIDFLA